MYLHFPEINAQDCKWGKTFDTLNLLTIPKTSLLLPVTSKGNATAGVFKFCQMQHLNLGWAEWDSLFFWFRTRYIEHLLNLQPGNKQLRMERSDLFLTQKSLRCQRGSFQRLETATEQGFLLHRLENSSLHHRQVWYFWGPWSKPPSNIWIPNRVYGTCLVSSVLSFSCVTAPQTPVYEKRSESPRCDSVVEPPKKFHSMLCWPSLLFH